MGVVRLPQWRPRIKPPGPVTPEMVRANCYRLGVRPPIRAMYSATFDAMIGRVSGFTDAGKLDFMGLESSYYSNLDVPAKTIIGNVKWTSNNGDYAGLEYGYYVSAGDNAQTCVGLWGATNNLYGVHRYNSSVSTGVLKAITLPYNAILGIGGTAGGTAQIYENGVNISPVSWSGGAWAQNTNCRLRATAAASTGKACGGLLYWNVELSAAEHLRIAQNFYAVFAPEARKIFVDLGAAPGGTPYWAWATQRSGMVTGGLH